MHSENFRVLVQAGKPRDVSIHYDVYVNIARSYRTGMCNPQHVAQGPAFCGPVMKMKDCSNYRTIALIPHASKIFLKIIQQRLSTIVDKEMPDVQAGFRESRGTLDHIANLRWIMEKTTEYQKDLYMCFIDYSKAFDVLEHNKL